MVINKEINLKTGKKEVDSTIEFDNFAKNLVWVEIELKH